MEILDRIRQAKDEATDERPLTLSFNYGGMSDSQITDLVPSPAVECRLFETQAECEGEPESCQWDGVNCVDA